MEEGISGRMQVVKVMARADGSERLVGHWAVGSTNLVTESRAKSVPRNMDEMLFL